MNNIRIAVIGLGYVGLPLARLFATKYPVVGFDLNSERITEIKSGLDRTLELDNNLLRQVLKENNNSQIGLNCSHNIDEIRDCNIYIVTVPTPVDQYNKPDLTPLYTASEIVARALNNGDIVIYESTVYPGLTEEKCVPLLEEFSGLSFNMDFFVGYSPERINPGDKEHSLEKIIKVTSGSTPETAYKVNQLYASVISAGTYLAPSIRIAEAAKVIENAQRDINIAFVNELAKIFNLMDIDTHEVLKAAGTKWNFIPFKPGLVGGHCIGVDPYYLAHKAQEFGYNSEIILAGRRLNDSMGNYIASEVLKIMIERNIAVSNSNILVLGITFKENCPDIRNTKSIDIIIKLKNHNAHISIYDPRASPKVVFQEYGLLTTQIFPSGKFDAIILTVAHKEFQNIRFRELLNKNGVLYDVKGFLSEEVDGRL